MSHDLTDAFPAGRWQARWIGADPTALPGRRKTAAFRRTVARGGSGPAPTRIWADSRYVLWIDGVEVARGPGRVNPRRARFDVVDLGPHLAGDGDATLAALVWFDGAATPWSMPGPTLVGALGSGAFVLEGRREGEVLVTDRRWRVLPLPGITAEAPSDIVSGRGFERLDLRDLPPGWTEPGFDDGAWGAARELGGFGLGEPGLPEPPTYPFGPMEARTVTPPTVESVPLAPGAAPGTWVATRVVVGPVTVEVEAPAGAEAVLRAGEFAHDDGTLVGDRFALGATVVGDGTRRRVQTLDAYGLTAVAVDAPESVVVHGVSVTERLHPVTGGHTFACSDGVLDRIWEVGRRTVSICSLDAYVDCPTREQRAWTGDHVVHQMVDLATNDDWTLARWGTLLAASPRADGMLPMAVAGDAEASDITVIPDWALHWVHAVWNLYRHVGDREEVARLLATAEGVVRWFEPYVDEDGCLADVIGWLIVDWASVPSDGVCTAVNGLWGRALLELAEMASWLGDEGRAAWARARHDRLRAGFERLWDPERERYAEGLRSGVRRVQTSQHAQAAALVGGVVPAERAARLVEVLTDADALVHATFSRPDGPAEPGSETEVGGAYLTAPRPEPWWDVDRQVVRAQPFFRYVVHDALVAAGRADLVATACRDWEVLLDRSATSWSECWFGGTVSHGWSSTPTRDLSTRVLGVTPAEPGFATARIAPALGDLGWARGSVPTPHGRITVDVTPARVAIDSPVPIVVGPDRLAAGRHEVPTPPVPGQGELR